jgi:hypothetical protein
LFTVIPHKLVNIVTDDQVIPSVEYAQVDDPSNAPTATNFAEGLLFPEKLDASEHVAPAVPPTRGKRSLLSRLVVPAAIPNSDRIWLTDREAGGAVGNTITNDWYKN